MKKEEYLNCLKSYLKRLPEEKQIELLDEITNHLDETLQGTSQIDTPDIEIEMGKPEELGRQLCRIHRQQRWLDFLLVLIPSWLISPLSSLILCFVLHESMGSLRNNSMAVRLNHYLFILFCFVLVIVGLRRYSHFGIPQLAVYWMVETWWGIVALNLSQQRWNMANLAIFDDGTIIETIIWFVVLVLLGSAVIRMMIHSRDLSIVVLGAIPFTIATANLVTGQYIMAGYFAEGYNLPSWNIGFVGMQQIILIVWSGLYFIPRNRNIRWIGLLIYTAYITLANTIVVFHHPGLFALWSTPILMVVAGYIIEQTLSPGINNPMYPRRN